MSEVGGNGEMFTTPSVLTWEFGLLWYQIHDKDSQFYRVHIQRYS